VYTQIRTEREGAVAHVVLSRPHVRNALSVVLREELDDALTNAAADDDVRVIVLSADGDHFSSGHDLGTAEERADAAARRSAADLAARHRDGWTYNVENTLRWRDLPKPTIAAVQGYCIFGAWIIVSAMDVIVAADDARFLPGPVQYFSLPWDVSPRKAKELLLTNRVLTAEEALDYGLVNSVVPRSDLAEETMLLAERISELDPFMAKTIKQSVNQAQDAMGFRHSIQSAYAGYLLLQSGGYFGQVDPEGRPRLPVVGGAIEPDSSGPD
jgi:enoyl-CoA hydratase